MKQLSLFLSFVILLLSIPVFRISTEATSSEPTSESPLVYSFHDFDEYTEGKSVTTLGENDQLVLTEKETSLDPQIVIHSGDNKALQLSQAKGSTNRVQATLYPFRVLGITDLNVYGMDLAVSYDLYISGNNGAAFTVFQCRGEGEGGAAWGKKLSATPSSDGKKATIGSAEIAYAAWNRITVVLHPAAIDRSSASADLYVNGQCAVKDFTIGKLSPDRFHIGEFYNDQGADKDCSFMIDDLCIYKSSQPCNDKELCLYNSVFCGLQTSEKIGDTFNLRVIAAIDSTAYEAVGFDIEATYTENSTTVKKTGSSGNITTVYTGILANEDAGIKEYTAEGLNGNYLAVMTLSDIPTNAGEIVITVSAWTKNDISVSPVKSVTNEMTITFHGVNENNSVKLEAQAHSRIYRKYDELAARITNNDDYSVNNGKYTYQGTRKTLSSLETQTLYQPTLEDEDSWFYNHHPNISCINGTLVAVWDQSPLNEGDCGQRIMYATATEFGSWSEPKILIDSTRGKYSDLVLTVQGIYNNGNELIVYYLSKEYEENALREDNTLRPETDTGVREDSMENKYITTTDGHNWSAPATMTRFNFGGGNHGPSLMENGELFYPAGGLWNAYTSDTSGLIWDGSSKIDRTSAIESGVGTLCEMSFYFRDGIMYNLGRTASPYLWVQFSEDYGRTWSKAYKTNFTDAESKFLFGKLPDGRYYCVSTPEPKTRRIPLVLAISEDGLSFDEQYILGDTSYDQLKGGIGKELENGVSKGGHYGYPHCYIGNDGYFYVIYSRGKEAMEVCRFALSEIGITSNAQ